MTAAWQNIFLSLILASEESEEGGPEGAAGEAVDDEVYARVQHEEKVVDAEEKEKTIPFTRSDLVVQVYNVHEMRKVNLSGYPFVSFFISNPSLPRDSNRC